VALGATLFCTSFSGAFGRVNAQVTTIPISTASGTLSQTIQVSPAFQEIVIDETQNRVEGEFTLTNDTSNAQNFTVFAVDIKQFDAEGRVILSDRPLSGAAYSLADFVQLRTPDLSFGPGETRAVPFTILNTPGLSPGGHYAALVARATATSSASLQQVLPALSSFLLVRKQGGEQYHLSLIASSLERQLFLWRVPAEIDLSFSNQGNVHVVPRGVIEVRDVFGRLTHKGTINQGSLYVFPGTQRRIAVDVAQVAWSWPVMIAQVQISGRSDPGDVSFTQSSTLIIAHPAGLGSVMFAVVVVCLAAWMWRKRA
jgi:hypothetical protein